MKNRIREIALDGTIRQNPTFRLVLGTCPTLAVTTTAFNSLGMGLAVTFVLICSNVIISLLRNVIPDRVRIPCFIVIIATFVTIVRMFMEAYIPDLYESLGVFLSLIVVNCIILGRAESYASHNPVGYSALDGLFMGLGFTVRSQAVGCQRVFHSVLYKRSRRVPNLRLAYSDIQRMLQRGRPQNQAQSTRQNASKRRNANDGEGGGIVWTYSAL